MSDNKTKAEITHVTGGGNSNGGHINVGGQITHNVTPNTQVYAQGNIGRYQSFQGHGGQNNYGGGVGVKFRF